MTLQTPLPLAGQAPSAERAAGGVGLIVTVGFSPNLAGWLKPFGGTLR